VKFLVPFTFIALIIGCSSTTVTKKELPWASSENTRLEDIKEWRNIKYWQTTSVIFCGIQIRGERFVNPSKEVFNTDISDLKALRYSKSGLRDERYSAFKFEYSEKIEKLRILGFKVKNPFFIDDEWTLFPKFNVYISDKTYEWSEDSSYDNKNHYLIYRDTLKLEKLTNMNNSRYPSTYRGGYQEVSYWNCREIL